MNMNSPSEVACVNTSCGHRSCYHAEAVTRASTAADKRRIAELEKELSRLRLSTKAALQQSWDEAETLQRVAAEREEDILKLRRELAESEGREREWRRKYEDVRCMLFSESRAALDAAPFNLDHYGCHSSGELAKAVAAAYADDVDLWDDAPPPPPRERLAGDAAAATPAAASASAEPTGDVSNRSLLRTIRRSFTHFSNSNGSFHSGLLPAADLLTDDDSDDGDPLPACGWDVRVPSSSTASSPRKQIQRERRRTLTPDRARLPPRPVRTQRITRQRSAPPEIHVDDDDFDNHGAVDDGASTATDRSGKKPWQLRDRVMSFTEMASLEKLQDECSVVSAPTRTRAPSPLPLRPLPGAAAAREKGPNVFGASPSDEIDTGRRPSAMRQKRGSFSLFQ